METSRPSRFVLVFLATCGGLSLIGIVPHVLAPLSTSRTFAPLMLGLIVVNVLAFIYAIAYPKQALQVYLWAVLVVVGIMVAVYTRDSTGKLPTILVIPSVATLIIRAFLNLKASVIYGVGTTSLLLLFGVVCNDIGRSGALIGSVVFGVGLVSVISTKLQRNGLDAILPQLIELRSELRRIRDEFTD